MIPALELPVEVRPGSSIEKAFSEALRIANTLGVVVTFDFNGTRCVARPGGEVSVGVKRYWDTANNNEPSVGDGRI